MSADPDKVAAATLACLPDMTPGRLRALLQAAGGPAAALALVRSGDCVPAIPVRTARDRESRSSPRTLLARPRRARPRWLAGSRRRGTHVWIDGDADYPIADAVPDRPAVLLGEGAAVSVLGAPRVAVVGTRAATPHGLADARELGEALGSAGITVVSGLAIGIDGAAHEGVLAGGGGAIGVVATGLDVTYPRRHAVLSDRVRRAGLVVSEQGFGVGPRRGLFPVRNRIIAALSDVVVVVEATIGGGARITAQYALDYGRTVLAVPGSRRNPSAAGTNALIADGAHPLLDWGDVLVALGMSPATARTNVPAPPRPSPGADGKALLAALGGECATPDELSSRTGLPTSRVALAVVDLERSGWIERAPARRHLAPLPAGGLFPGEARLALLDEREHRLSRVGGADGERLRDVLELEGFAHRDRQRLVQQLLRDRDLHRWLRGDAARQLLDLALEVGGRHDPVHDPDSARRRRRRSSPRGRRAPSPCGARRGAAAATNRRSRSTGPVARRSPRTAPRRTRR